jgi:hypothetical protein
MMRWEEKKINKRKNEKRVKSINRKKSCRKGGSAVHRSRDSKSGTDRTLFSSFCLFIPPLLLPVAIHRKPRRHIY